MNKLVHDTAFAHLVRLVAGSRALSYMEEGTPEIQDFYRENKESVLLLSRPITCITQLTCVDPAHKVTLGATATHHLNHR